MKILLSINKYLQRGLFNRIDAGYWNFYIPMMQLGHEVLFYDIESGNDTGFMKTVENFNPDLIFCCLTFIDSWKEPTMEEIRKLTKEGNIKTFNWFCDDTWRFEQTSKNLCWNFTACSTPEPTYIQKYKNIGYDNIILGMWHANKDFCQVNNKKNYDLGFCGGLNNQRINMISKLRNENINIGMFYGGTYEEMMTNYSLSKIGINFSVNANDPELKTQMKARMVEVPASKSLLFTEYTQGIEEFFTINKEIICFTEEQEMVDKIKYLLNNEKFVEKISFAGYERFLRDHESKVR